jgi:hypothetical protein
MEPADPTARVNDKCAHSLVPGAQQGLLRGERPGCLSVSMEVVRQLMEHDVSNEADP